jgi:hypothetical protein
MIERSTSYQIIARDWRIWLDENLSEPKLRDDCSMETEDIILKGLHDSKPNRTGDFVLTRYSPFLRIPPWRTLH